MSDNVLPVVVGFVVYGVVVGDVVIPAPGFPSVSTIPPMLRDDMPICAIDHVCSRMLTALLNKPPANILTLTVFNSLKMIKMDRNLSEV